MKTSEQTVCLRVDPANPGQFFACCGLLELADRLWNGAEGYFDTRATEFRIVPIDSSSDQNLLRKLSACRLTNTMSCTETDRLERLKVGPASDLSAAEKSEKKALEKSRREKPLVLDAPFNIRLDWFLDHRAGGKRFKTWAGQQSVIDIATSMKQPLEDGVFDNLDSADWLRTPGGDGVSFNFDSDLGAQSSPLDMGFSLDPLGMSIQTRPLLELAAFVGLQRFRPCADPKQNRYAYSTWTTPLLPSAAVAAVSRKVCQPGSKSFQFALLFRTKYLKSFLPAQPIRGER